MVKPRYHGTLNAGTVKQDLCSEEKETPLKKKKKETKKMSWMINLLITRKAAWWLESLPHTFDLTPEIDSNQMINS